MQIFGTGLSLTLAGVRLRVHIELDDDACESHAPFEYDSRPPIDGDAGDFGGNDAPCNDRAAARGIRDPSRCATSDRG